MDIEEFEDLERDLLIGLVKGDVVEVPARMMSWQQARYLADKHRLDYTFGSAPHAYTFRRRNQVRG